mgnify:CR=1 FL=1
MNLLRNPLLPGFYPDPSICRVGEDYYLVTSTFEYFPGVPIFHSRDLVHWHQIGHCLTRPSQLPLYGTLPSKGIYAPTLRYHQGTFYMITTLVRDEQYDHNVNFYVTAKDPAGPWSEPVVVEGADGIDPTLFFDGDQAYYLGNMRPDPDSAGGSRYIWLQTLDISTGKLTGERRILLTDGALYHAHAPEGPHLYHVGGYYYLLIAEGGTSKDHAVTVFRSRCVTGPYEGNPRNPVFTHRNLSRNSAINSTGHADLVETQNGEWWAVMLASRPDGGNYRCLGRETYALPVIWEEDWPVFSPDTGRMEFTFPAPQLPSQRWPAQQSCEHFDTPRLPLSFSLVRTPDLENPPYSLTAHPGYLRLYTRPQMLTECSCPAFVGRRQQHLSFVASARMHFSPKRPGEWAGIVMLMSAGYQLRMERGLIENRPVLRLVSCIAGKEQVEALLDCPAQALVLKMESVEQCCTFTVAQIDSSGFAGSWQILAQQVDLLPYSTLEANRFTGTFLGMYATSSGQPSDNFADFDWFSYQGIDQ